MNHASATLFLIAAVWLVIVVVVARRTIRSNNGSVGLPAAFLFAMSFSYCGFLTYVNPGYSHVRSGGSLYLQSYDFDEQTVLLGVTASLLGVFGFAIGCFVSDKLIVRQPTGSRGDTKDTDAQRRKVLWYLGSFGLLSIFAARIETQIPLFAAVTKVGQTAAIATIMLGAVFAVFFKKGGYVRWLLMGLALPITYILLNAVTSTGLVVFSLLAAFWLAVLSPRELSAKVIAIGSASIFYLMLVTFVAWMSFREKLRNLDDGSLMNRIDVMTQGFSEIEWLTLTNFDAFDYMNGRLNQYIFVGKVIERHELVPSLQLFGETLYMAPLAIVPRFLWPDKPKMGGSEFLSTQSGMTFADNVTFGAGPVVELFANFGYWGIFGGFIILGVIVRWADLKASIALMSRQWLGFARWFVVGAAFVAPLSTFFFFFNEALIGFLIMGGLVIWLREHMLHTSRGPRDWRKRFPTRDRAR